MAGPFCYQVQNLPKIADGSVCSPPGCWRSVGLFAARKPTGQRALDGGAGAHGSPLLETFTAIDGASLRRLEGHRGFLAALRANGLGFDSLHTARAGTHAGCTSCLAGFAPLGLVLEALVGEKHLFARGEDKLRIAFGALQDFIVIFHSLLRDLAGRGQRAMLSMSDNAVPWGCPAVPAGRLHPSWSDVSTELATDPG